MKAVKLSEMKSMMQPQCLTWRSKLFYLPLETRIILGFQEFALRKSIVKHYVDHIVLIMELPAMHYIKIKC